MARSLDEMLATPSCYVLELGSALRRAWCCARQAEATGRRPPPPPGLGRSLLVSVRRNEPCGTLWELVHDLPGLDPADPDEWEVARPLDGEVGATMVLAVGMALRDLECLPAAALAQLPPLTETLAHWRAALIVSDEGGCAPPQLAGASFGLGMLLGVSGLLLRAALPADLCGLAAIDADGLLKPVEELPAKVDVLLRYAKGVRRLLVAKPQEELVRGIVKDRGAHEVLEVIGKARLDEAMRVAFPDMERVACQGVIDLPTAAARSLNLACQAIEGTNVLVDWTGIAGWADTLDARLAELGASDEPRDQVHFARQIALRHCGRPAPLDWPSERSWVWGLARRLRLAALAHVVQAAADDGRPDAGGIIGRAREVASLDGDIPDLKLLGAVGRAAAALRDYATARETLEHVVREWRRARCEAEATYALCELLRVLGIASCVGADLFGERGPGLTQAEARARVRTLVAEWLPSLERNRSVAHVSLLFVRLAAGRALVQAGDAPAALGQIGALPPGDPRARLLAWSWGVSPWHVQFSRLRWLARAHTLAGETRQADEVRAALRASADAVAERYVLLADIDEARERGGQGLAERVERARERKHLRELQRYMGFGRTSDETATIVAEEFRY